MNPFNLFRPPRSLRTGLHKAALLASLITVVAGVAAVATPGPGDSQARVGRQPDGSVLLPTNQKITPAGRQIELPGWVTGVAIDPDGGKAVVHAASGNPSLFVVDLVSGRLVQSYDGARDSGSFDGIIFTPDGDTLISSGASGSVAFTEIGQDGTLNSSRTLNLPSQLVPPLACCNPYPGGLATSADGLTAYVALSRANKLGVLGVAGGSIAATIPVGNAPHSVVVGDGIAYVSNEGGRPARPGDYTNDSAGTQIVADPFTGAAVTGTVSVVDLAESKEVATIEVGLHPTALLLAGTRLFVANTGSDTISIIDTATLRVEQTISVSPFPEAPYGAQPNSLAMLPDGRLAVTLGSDNAVAIIDWQGDQGVAEVDGLIPVGWFPAGIAVDEERGQLIVANEKGVGSVGDADAGRHARGVGSEIASVSLIPFPSLNQLQTYTSAVFANNGWDRIDRTPPRPDAEPVAIPLHLGEPSLIKHVVYIIKENRTYDQVLGDIGRGESDPQYAVFGEKVTPNTHALATRFPLLDNFYQSGRRSNDGHQWATQASSPDYLEKGVTTERVNYTSGGTPPSAGFDALLYMPSGFIWENALRHGKTFLDFGEYTAEGNPPPARSDKPSLAAHLVPEYQGYNLDTPDTVRAQIFNNYVQAWTAAGEMPNLVMAILPLDHTGGNSPLYDTPESMVANNDAALGMMVDAISHSPFWKDTVIFVEEDDSQGGVDHIDGHRSLCLVISPYAKRDGFVDSTYFTQLDVLRTIEQILGLPPMNHMDLAAQPMFSAFTDTPDLTPYNASLPDVPLSVPNPPLSELRGIERVWARFMLRQDLTSEPDAMEPALLNRDIWYAVTGFTEPYPGDRRVLRPWEVPRSEFEGVDED